MTTPDLVAQIRKNPLLTACGVLSIGLGVALFFRSGLVGEANAELDEKSTEARRYALNITNGVQLKEQLAQITAANEAIQARLILASDIGINQQYFYKLESETGVKLTEINQSMRPAGAKGAVVPVTFNVSAQGDFAHVMAFLRALEGGSHFCRVVSASLSSSRGAPVTLSMSVELLGKS